MKTIELTSKIWQGPKINDVNKRLKGRRRRSVALYTYIYIYIYIFFFFLFKKKMVCYIAYEYMKVIWPTNSELSGNLIRLIFLNGSLS